MNLRLLPVLLLVACAHARVASPTPRAVTNVTTRQDVPGAIASDTPVRGPATALVTIVEFADFQCPFCARAEATMASLKEQYGDRIRVAFRQLPLDFHEHAKVAAEASLAAQAQGKFWEMHDALYAHAADLGDEGIHAAAREAGLDVAKLDAALAAHTYEKVVAAEAKHAHDVGMTGTPEFVVNGRRIAGAQPLSVFHDAVEEALKTSQALAQLGAPADHLYDIQIVASAFASPPSADDDKPAPKRPEPPKLARAEIAAWTPIRGNATAKVTIVEYSDFQCPFCARASVTIDKLRKAYGAELRIAYRHNPLPFHPNARTYAQLSMAAKEQGKFWEVHDYLFNRDTPLEVEDYPTMAKALKLDLGKLLAALEAHDDQIDADMKAAADLLARGTPTFFINGHRLVGAQPEDEFRAVIDAELRHADKVLARGVKPNELYDALMKELPEK